jgi:hypothetical protein
VKAPANCRLIGRWRIVEAGGSQALTEWIEGFK